MNRRIALMLGLEAIAFTAASLIHFGQLLPGYSHRKAAIAEGIIACILSVGVVLSAISKSNARRAGLWAQGLALVGTLIGAFTIAIGVGPQTTADIVYHVLILAVLVWIFVRLKRLPESIQVRGADA